MRPLAWLFPIAVSASLCATVAPEVRAVTSLPLRFEPATDGVAHFLAKGRDYTLDIHSQENTLTWPGKNATISLRTRFQNSSDKASMQGVGLLPSRTNYFFGASPKAWRTDVANFQRVRIRGLYPGIDLVFRGSEGSVEYDFIAQPGADLSAIRFQILGATRMRVELGRRPPRLPRTRERSLESAPSLSNNRRSTHYCRWPLRARSPAHSVFPNRSL